MPKGAPLLLVDDVLGALNDLARASRARSRARIVAVTGSVGKTSTKEALRLVLGRQGETHAAAASYNNHWGVPLTLALMPNSAQFGVFEIGMNHAGEITPLVKLVRPACCDDHHDCAGASGILRHARRDRGCQGGNLCRRRARAAPPSSMPTHRSSRASGLPRRPQASIGSWRSASETVPMRGS